MFESELEFSPWHTAPAWCVHGSRSPAQLSSPGQQTRLPGLSPAATRRPQQEEYE
ncbi:hypothetical protein ACGFT2_22450 [Streptomyces sp. NPDC048514]|uniref:hypothetical protein n=1 Tax=Streptomyces sp. NPDC048514 TaxID=3365564 RepID=UPI00370FD699